MERPFTVEKQTDKAVENPFTDARDLKVLNTELAKEDFTSINIGIGLNTGDVVVGNMGWTKDLITVV